MNSVDEDNPGQSIAPQNLTDMAASLIRSKATSLAEAEAKRGGEVESNWRAFIVAVEADKASGDAAARAVSRLCGRSSGCLTPRQRGSFRAYSRAQLEQAAAEAKKKSPAAALQHIVEQDRAEGIARLQRNARAGAAKRLRTATGVTPHGACKSQIEEEDEPGLDARNDDLIRAAKLALRMDTARHAPDCIYLLVDGFPKDANEAVEAGVGGVVQILDAPSQSAAPPPQHASAARIAAELSMQGLSMGMGGSDSVLPQIEAAHAQAAASNAHVVAASSALDASTTAPASIACSTQFIEAGNTTKRNDNDLSGDGSYPNEVDAAARTGNPTHVNAGKDGGSRSSMERNGQRRTEGEPDWANNPPKNVNPRGRAAVRIDVDVDLPRIVETGPTARPALLPHGFQLPVATNVRVVGAMRPDDLPAPRNSETLGRASLVPAPTVSDTSLRQQTTAKSGVGYCATTPLSLDTTAAIRATATTAPPEVGATSLARMPPPLFGVAASQPIEAAATSSGSIPDVLTLQDSLAAVVVARARRRAHREALERGATATEAEAEAKEAGIAAAQTDSGSVNAAACHKDTPVSVHGLTVPRSGLAASVLALQAKARQASLAKGIVPGTAFVSNPKEHDPVLDIVCDVVMVRPDTPEPDPCDEAAVAAAQARRADAKWRLLQAGRDEAAEDALLRAFARTVSDAAIDRALYRSYLASTEVIPVATEKQGGAATAAAREMIQARLEGRPARGVWADRLPEQSASASAPQTAPAVFAAYISVSRSVARFVPEAGMSEAAVLECIVDAVAVAHGDSDTHADANAKTAANSVHASCALDGAWVIDASDIESLRASSAIIAWPYPADAPLAVMCRVARAAAARRAARWRDAKLPGTRGRFWPRMPQVPALSEADRGMRRTEMASFAPCATRGAAGKQKLSDGSGYGGGDRSTSYTAGNVAGGEVLFQRRVSGEAERTRHVEALASLVSLADSVAGAGGGAIDHVESFHARCYWEEHPRAALNQVLLGASNGATCPGVSLLPTYDASTDAVLLALHTPAALGRIGLLSWTAESDSGAAQAGAGKAGDIGGARAHGAVRALRSFDRFRVERWGDDATLFTPRTSNALQAALDVDAETLAGADEKSVCAFPAGGALVVYRATSTTRLCSAAGVWVNVFLEDNVLSLHPNIDSGGVSAEKAATAGIKAAKAINMLLSKGDKVRAAAAKANLNASLPSPPQAALLEGDDGDISDDEAKLTPHSATADGGGRDMKMKANKSKPRQISPAVFVANLSAPGGGSSTRFVVDDGPQRPHKPDGFGTVRISATLPTGLVTSVTSSGDVSMRYITAVAGYDTNAEAGLTFTCTGEQAAREIEARMRAASASCCSFGVDQKEPEPGCRAERAAGAETGGTKHGKVGIKGNHAVAAAPAACTVPAAAREERVRHILPLPSGAVCVLRELRNGVREMLFADGSVARCQAGDEDGDATWVTTNAAGVCARAGGENEQGEVDDAGRVWVRVAAQRWAAEGVGESVTTQIYDNDIGDGGRPCPTAKARKVLAVHREVDAITGDIVITREDGVRVIVATAARGGSTVTRHADGTTFTTAADGSATQIESEGFSTVVCDTVAAAMMVQHSAGKPVSSSLSGTRAILGVSLPDGASLKANYNVACTAPYHGAVAARAAGGETIYVGDDTRVIFRSRTLAAAQPPAVAEDEPEPDRIAGAYVAVLRKATLKIADLEHNRFKFTLDGALPIARLAGEASGIKANAVVAAPRPPRLFVLRGDGRGAELLDASQLHLHEGRAAMVNAASRRNGTGMMSIDDTDNQVFPCTRLAPAPLYANGGVENVSAGRAQAKCHTYVQRLAPPATQRVSLAATAPSPPPPPAVALAARPPMHAESAPPPAVTVVRHVVEVPPVNAVERGAVLREAQQWEQWRDRRAALDDQYCVHDPRSGAEQESELALQKKIMRTYKAARAKLKAEREKAKKKREAQMAALASKRDSQLTTAERARQQELQREAQAAAEEEAKEMASDKFANFVDSEEEPETVETPPPSPRSNAIKIAFHSHVRSSNAARPATVGSTARIHVAQMRSALVDGLGRGVSAREVSALLARLRGNAQVSDADAADTWYDEAAFTHICQEARAAHEVLGSSKRIAGNPDPAWGNAEVKNDHISPATSIASGMGANAVRATRNKTMTTAKDFNLI